MELTQEILKHSGFKTNHEDRMLPTFYCYSPKNDKEQWRIMVVSECLTMNNIITYNCDIQKWNEKGAISKRASLTDIRTTEDLNQIIALCGIDLTIA